MKQQPKRVPRGFSKLDTSPDEDGDAGKAQSVRSKLPANWGGTTPGPDGIESTTHVTGSHGRKTGRAKR